MDRYSKERVSGFLHADGRRMCNGNGEEIILRGWGAGNWTNPEGFLCGDHPRPWSGADPRQAPGPFDRARTIEDSIRLLCGSEYAREFWPKWYRNHLGEADIRAMAEYGYNSVRLPLNARVFLSEEPNIRWNEDGFRMLTDVLDWCEKYRLYAILDLHAAPGGQSGIRCDDGLESFPRLFLEQESMERTMLLWEEIARRCRDRWIVGGYDLLNEPLAPSGSLYLMPQLSAFYDRLIARIRAIDKNHMITLEGAQAATNTEIFDHNFDPECNNWCIHVHYYGLSPERRSLFRFLEPSQRLDVPVWLGEGGGACQDMAALLESADCLGIGFNLWSWKVSTLPDGTLRRDPVQYRLPANWESILSCLYEGSPRPSYVECQSIFDEMLENMRFENCILSPEQHAYILRRPGREVPAAAYDSDPHSFYGGWEYGNVFDYRTEDKIKMVLKDGSKPPRRAMAFDSGPVPAPKPLDNLLLELTVGEYVSYTVLDVTEKCSVRLSVRAAIPSSIQISNGNGGYMVQLPGDSVFKEIESLSLPVGSDRRVRIEVLSGRIQIDHITF